MGKHEVKIKVTQTGAKKTGTAISGVTKALGGLALGYIAFRAAGAGLRFLKGTTQDFARQEAVIGRLNALIKNSPDYYAAAGKEIVAYTEKLQKSGVVADDVSQAGISQLATFKLSVENIKKLIPALQDVIVAQYGVNATQESAIASANMLGKVYAGQVGMLARVGISMTDAQKQMLKVGDQTQQTAMLVSILNDNFGGLNKEMRKTSLGEFTAMSQAWGDLKELVGAKFVEKMKPTVVAMTKFFQSTEGTEFADKLSTSFETVAEVALRVAEALGLIDDAQTRLMKNNVDRAEQSIAKWKKDEKERKRLRGLKDDGVVLSQEEDKSLDYLDRTADIRKKGTQEGIRQGKKDAKVLAKQAHEQVAKDEARSTIPGALGYYGKKIPIAGEAGQGIGEMIAGDVERIGSMVAYFAGLLNKTTVGMNNYVEAASRNSEDIDQNIIDINEIKNRPKL